MAVNSVCVCVCTKGKKEINSMEATYWDGLESRIYVVFTMAMINTRDNDTVAC